VSAEREVVESLQVRFYLPLARLSHSFLRDRKFLSGAHRARELNPSSEGHLCRLRDFPFCIRCYSAMTVARILKFQSVVKPDPLDALAISSGGGASRARRGRNNGRGAEPRDINPHIAEWANTHSLGFQTHSPIVST